MNPSLQHPSHARLVAFADGKLSGTELSDVQQHVQQCDECAATVEALFDECTFLKNVQHAHRGATANGGESDLIEAEAREASYQPQGDAAPSHIQFRKWAVFEIGEPSS